MADLVQTPANVRCGSNVQINLVTASEAITQGMPVYQNALTSKYAQADSDAEATAAASAIALTPASADNDSFVIAYTQGENGNIDLGATLTVGETYVVSTNTGKIAPIGDLTSGDYVTSLGVASATNNLLLNINVTGVAKP